MISTPTVIQSPGTMRPFSLRRGLLLQLAAIVLTCCVPGCGTSTQPMVVPSTSTPSSTTNPANGSTPAEGSLPGQGPKVLVEGGEVFDFGAREVGESFKHVYMIKNVGDSDLILKAGQPSCATCTSFDLDKTVVKPGESARGTVTWKVTIENPSFRQFAPFSTNDPNKADVKLQAICRVIKRFDLSPAGLWDFNDIEAGQPKQIIATLSSGIVEQFRIDSCTNTSSALKVTATPMTSEDLAKLKAKSGYVLSAVLDAEIPVGRFNDQVSINIQAPEARTFKVDVKARRGGPLQIIGPDWNEERMALGLGAFDPKQPFVTRLNLFTRGIPDELKISKVTCPDDRFSVELKPDTRFKESTGEVRRYELFVKVAASSREAIYSNQKPLLIMIDTNQDQIKQFKLKITSQALP